jgi:hypothetical protein
MGRSRPAPLGVGDRVVFDGRTRTVVGLDGTLVRLADTGGAVLVVAVAHLLTSVGFAVVAGGGPVPLASAMLTPGLPEAAAERARFWERHVVEVMTGLPPDAAEGARPRPGYDPAVHTVAEREETKAAELAALGVAGASARTVRRKRQNYEARRVAGLVDGRAGRTVAPPLGRADARVVEAVRAAIDEQRDDATRTGEYLRWRAERILAERHGDAVAMPSRSAFYRLLAVVGAGEHVTGSARTRRSLANRPDRPFGQVVAVRPGELMEIDSTPLDVEVHLADGVTGRVELTAMVDLATRSVTAAVLRPTTRGVDAALLLARSCTPELMRPGWPAALELARSVLPWQHLVGLDQRLAHAAAMPVIVPEVIVCDRGKAYLSHAFRDACQALGISLQPAHPRTPTDKPHIERTLESVSTLFCQFVAGYLGRSVETRGTGRTGRPLWSLAELQALLDEWLVAVWQNRPHDGLRDPSAPGRAFTPNEKYAALVAVAGYVPLALSGEDYLELLPRVWRVVNAYGVKIGHRIYDSPDLDRLRQQPSGVTDKRGLWEVRHDPYDITQVWLRHHWDGGWISLPWRHLSTVPAPFGELAWDHARRARPGATEAELAAAAADLLDRAHRGPDQLPAVDRRVAARTRAATPSLAGTRAPATAPSPAASKPTTSKPRHGEPADGGDPAAPLAPVIPLGIFDAHEEARKRW